MIVFTAGSMHSNHLVRSFEMHTVKPGETLWSIACDVYDKGCHRDVREIMFEISQDNLISNGKIYPGQILKIQYWKISN